MEPNSVPTSGTSTYTTSPSSDCAKSVTPMVASSPSTFTHSWLLAYLSPSITVAIPRPSTTAAAPAAGDENTAAGPARCTPRNRAALRRLVIAISLHSPRTLNPSSAYRNGGSRRQQTAIVSLQ